MNASRVYTYAAGLVLFAVALPSVAQTPMGTAFTYQGQLKSGGVPVDATTCGFEFSLWDAASGPTQIGSTVSTTGVAVTNGLFTVTVDFNTTSVFDGDMRWLEVSVQCPGDGGFTTLSPRQELTPTPYALQTRGIYVNDARNVGIGTDTPASKLDVVGTAEMDGFKLPTGAANGRVLTSDASGVGTWQAASEGIGGSGSTNYIPKFTGSTSLGSSAIYQNGTSIGIGTTVPGQYAKLHVHSADEATFKMTNGNTGTNYNDGGLLTFWSASSSDMYLLNRENAAILFGTNNGERMRLTSAGDLGIGTSTPGYRLDVNGDIQCVALHETSDARFKTNIAPLSDSLAKVSQLRGVRFDWRRDDYPEKGFAEERQVGFIAQEVKEVAPELVSQGSDGYFAVDYSRLTPLLVEAVKELDGSLESKEAEIADLKDRLAKMEALVGELAGSVKGGAR